MGIDVVNQQVIYNASHQDGLNTSSKTNPFREVIQKALTVHSIFRRRQLKRGHRGDGNPFIYALKRKDGFTITRREFAKFLPEFGEILDKAMQGKNTPLFIPMPSSHRIADILARRAAKISGGHFMKNVFVKQTAGQVADQIVAMDLEGPLRGAASQLAAGLMKNPNATFTMKDVKEHDLRPYLAPLAMTSNIVLPAATEIILVDDLLCSGSTLMTAREELAQHGVTVPISGLCLLSSTRN